MHTRTPASAARVLPVAPTVSALLPLPLPDVTITAGPWARLQTLNRSTIIPHCLEWMERLGWTANFDRAADGTIGDGHRGREFADSEVYKVLEAMAWDHARAGDSAFEDVVVALVERVGAAQDVDGYLHTLFGRDGQRARYSDFVWGHELYCFGHLIQAAVARARTSDDEHFLEIARCLADHVCAEFGPSGREQVCGHAEIEVALVELYRLTGESAYLDQAKLFVERRGTGTLPRIEFGRTFYQDDVPVREAKVLRGHAVRALYLAAGAVDVAVETGDDELLAALVGQWDNTVARRTYITGGMGSHHMDEAFGEDYVLPADRSYCETCAGVAAVMFSWRLLLATGETRYADLIERILYNVIATSPARDGRSFFYANTLHQRVAGAQAPLNEDGVAIRGGSSGRQAWFEVSCCPPNLARTLASLAGYLLTSTDGGVQIHQYAPMRATAQLGGSGRSVELEVDTDYPRAGTVAVRILRTDGESWTLRLRVPQWARGARLTIGGTMQEVGPGVVDVHEDFRVGQTVVLELPVEPRWTVPDGRIDAVRGCVALERGPEVHCLESTDLPDGTTTETVCVDTAQPPVAADDAVVVRLVPTVRSTADWPFRETNGDIPVDEQVFDCALRPYNDWGNRGPSTMRIWIPIR